MEERDPQLALAVALTAVAGAVDAIGLLRLSPRFVSFMSGNTTQLGAALARGEAGGAKLLAALIAIFCAGALAGRLLRHATGRAGRPAVLAGEALLLAGAALARTPEPLAFGLIAFAMGVQNAVIHRAAGAKTGLTYVTGTLVNFSERCADALVGKGRLAAALPPLGLWLGFCVGAFGGGEAFSAFGLRALLLPAAVLVSLTLITAVSRRLRGDAPD